jgi:hypothetical protein
MDDPTTEGRVRFIRPKIWTIYHPFFSFLAAFLACCSAFLAFLPWPAFSCCLLLARAHTRNHTGVGEQRLSCAVCCSQKGKMSVCVCCR